MTTEMFSYEKAREIIKPLQFKTVVEYSKWVEENNYTHFLPLNPQNYYHPTFQGWEFLGFDCLQDYRDAVVKARIANTNYAESARKSAISRARNRASRANTTTSTTTSGNTTVKTTVNTTVTTSQPSQNDLHSTKQMVEFFIKEDVDIKVIINFLAEYSHPKEVYLIFLEHLKSKLPVKI